MRGTCAAAPSSWVDHDPAAAPGSITRRVDLDPAARWISTTPPLKSEEGRMAKSVRVVDFDEAREVHKSAVIVLPFGHDLSEETLGGPAECIGLCHQVA